MKQLAIATVILFLQTAAWAEGPSCWTFSPEPETHIKELILDFTQPETKDQAQIVVLAKLDDGDSIGGTILCDLNEKKIWECERFDEGGAFDFEIKGRTATFSTSRFEFGSVAADGNEESASEDGLNDLELESDPSDPWVFEGTPAACPGNEAKGAKRITVSPLKI